MIFATDLVIGGNMKKAIMTLGLLVLLGLIVSSAFAIKMELEVLPNPMYERCHISYFVDKPADLVILITDKEGKLVKNIDTSKINKGFGYYDWDRIDNEGNWVLPGEYQIEMRTNAKYTSLKKIIILK